jgi:hypothetical protein
MVLSQRTANHIVLARRNGMKVRIPIIGLVFLCLVRLGSAEGAELRYVRIGEHKAYTRIVFEFRGEASFKEPVVKGKGRFSVVFENTTTALPMQIAGETSKRVDVITFAQGKSHLVANITVSFPYFGIKSFSILKPDRVVLDVTPLSKPPKGVVFEERLDTESAFEPKEATPSKPPVEPKAEAKVETQSTSVQTTSEEAVKAVEGRKTTEPAEQIPTPSPSQAGSSQEVANAVPVSVKEPPRPQATEKDVPHAKQADAPPPVGAGGGRLQTTLLVVLLALSTVIVGLLALIVFRKRRVVEKKAGLFQMPDDPEDSLATIDDKLKRELSKIG